MGCGHAGHASRHVSCIIAADDDETTARRPSARREKNQPLVDDIRLLGRILGDVIREQEGKAAFERVERVRQLAVAYRLKRDAQRRPRPRPAAEEPERRPDGERDPRLQLLLAPRQHRRGPPPPAPARASTSARAISRRARWRWRSSGWRGAASARRRSSTTLNRAYISPVLTAHPTEVQRKSILDAERAIAELLAARDAAARARASSPTTRR